MFNKINKGLVVMKILNKKDLVKSYFRLDMDKEEYDLLVDVLNYVGADKRRLQKEVLNAGAFRDSLYKKVEDIKQIEVGKKKGATNKAHQTKKDNSMKKVKLAIEELGTLKRTVTAYSVSKQANISFITAQKYLNVLKEDK